MAVLNCSRRIVLGVSALSLGACAQTLGAPGSPAAQADAAQMAPAGCPQGKPQAFAARLLGDWRVEISTDEGWPGAGTSTIDASAFGPCVVVETGTYSLSAPERLIEGAGVTQLSWDVLDETWKLTILDARGITHVGVAAPGGPDGEIAFEIARPDGDEATRRAVYRTTGPDSFERAWQGRQSGADDWADRLVSVYTRP